MDCVYCKDKISYLGNFSKHLNITIQMFTKPLSG